VPDSDLSAVFRSQRKDNPAQRWAWGFSSKEITIAEILQQAGYRAGMVGKWHLGYDVLFHPCNHGFDSFHGFMGGAVDYHTHIATHGLRTLDWWDNRELRNEAGYTTDLLTKHATDFITRHKNEPFFLYLPHGAPHTPLQVRDPNSAASKIDRYRGMIGILDESVAAVVAALEANGLREKTMIIFCSDNGPQMTFGTTWRTAGQFAGLKDSLQEGGIRVPCIVSWPGKIPQGAVVNAPVMTMDFFPTLASLGGVSTPADHRIDGSNMLPILTGADAGPHRALHWESRGKWVVRRDQWKLSDGTKLVDLNADPTESQNLAAANPALVQELTELHNHWFSQMPAAPPP
jgi:arylsulfatase A-like enzyme